MTGRRATDRRAGNALRFAGAVLFWLTAWQVASMAVGSGLILAGPVDTLEALARLVPTGAFWAQIGFSALRIVGGCAAGYAAAACLAAAAWRWRWLRELLHPALSVIKSTPVACVVVLLLIWFGSRNVSAVAVFLMVVPGVYFPVLMGLDELDSGQRELFETFGAGRLVRLLALAWPGILPYVTAASQTVLGMSWKAGVAAELIGVPLGSIGERIYQAKLLLETADLFAWTAVVVALSWAFERAALAGLQASWPMAGRIAARMRCRASSSNVEASSRITIAKLIPGHDGHGVCVPVSFKLAPGEALCAMGPSGAGKTTLLRTLAGLQAPVSGTISARMNMRMAAMFQSTRLVDGLSAFENVELFADSRLSGRAIRDLLAEVLPDVDPNTPAGELSGGQRRRVELVRAFAAPAELVLLDEPFTGLDAQAHRQALAFISRHRAGRAIVLATHDPADATALGAQSLLIRPA